MEHEHRQGFHKRRRRTLDIIVVLLFLLAFFGVLFSHLYGKYLERERYHNVLMNISNPTKSLVATDTESSGEQIRLTSANTGSDEEMPDAVLDDVGSDVSESFSEDSSNFPPNDLAQMAGDGVVPVAATNTVLEFPKYEDVTQVRYENQRLGFVMELPSDWRIVAENSRDMLWANGSYSYGAGTSTVAKTAGVLWLDISRDCASTDATSTVFAFVDDATTSVRQAIACIPPLFVTLGYRADVSDRVAREKFLLSIARTIYPIVR